jgi:4-amino-4-deoxy-L-arabinose transferase-like glycosyltransferase
MINRKIIGFWVIVLGIYLISRLVNLTLIPIFADEAIYIHWAQRAWHNATERFISFSDGKPPLHTWLMIPFLKLIADPLIAGRLLSVLSGLMTVIGTYLFCRIWFGKAKALFVLPFTLFSPFLLFYDRMAVADSLLTAFYIWSGVLALYLQRRPDLGKAFLLSFVLAGSFLTKQTGIYAFGIVLFISLFFSNEKNKKKSWAYSVLALIIGYSLYYGVIKLAPESHLLNSRTYDYVLGKREWLSAPFKLFWGNIKAIIFWVGSYQTIGWLVLLPVATITFLKYSHKWLVLLAAIGMPILGSAFIGKIIFPRYFLLVQPYLNVWLAISFYYLWEKARKPLRNLLWLLFFPVLVFDIMLLFNPVDSPLISREKNQYLTTWSSGWGIKDIALYLISHYSGQPVTVYTEGYFGTLPDGLLVYLDRYPNISVQGIGQPIYHLPEQVIKTATNSAVFLVANSTRISVQDEGLELVNEYPKPEIDSWQEKLLFYQIKK